jgi:superfamily II DNA or RNA helicase
MELFNHQKLILEKDPTYSGLFIGTGGGKTAIALHLARGKTLVIAPKQLRLDRTWERNAEKFSIAEPLTVMSKEDFRSAFQNGAIGEYDTVIIDECHHFLSGISTDTRTVKGQPVPKISQLTAALISYIKKTPPKRLYLLSATPASKPMHVFTMGVILGRWGLERYFEFREKYYFRTKKGYREFWIPRKSQEHTERLAELVKSMGETGTLSDWFDVPEQTHKVEHVMLTPEQTKAIKDMEKATIDPMTRLAKMRTLENGCEYVAQVEQITAREQRLTRGKKTYKNNKVTRILELAEEFPKLLIFAQYTAQVEQIAEALKAEGHTVFSLTGKTKDRGTIFQDAEKLPSAYVVAQADIAEGYEWKSCNVVVWASKSTKFYPYDQGKGRVLRADAIKKNLYVHLVVPNGQDEKCHETIMRGEDFQERIHLAD